MAHITLQRRYDREFHAGKPVHPALLNDDGTPKKVYHGSDKTFTTFKSADGTYWFSENEDYAEAMAEERTGKFGVTLREAGVTLTSKVYGYCPWENFAKNRHTNRHTINGEKQG